MSVLTYKYFLAQINWISESRYKKRPSIYLSTLYPQYTHTSKQFVKINETASCKCRSIEEDMGDDDEVVILLEKLVGTVKDGFKCRWKPTSF